MGQEITDDGSSTLFGQKNERLGRLDQRTEGQIKGFPLRPHGGAKS